MVAKVWTPAWTSHYFPALSVNVGDMLLPGNQNRRYLRFMFSTGDNTVLSISPNHQAWQGVINSAVNQFWELMHKDHGPIVTEPWYYTFSSTFQIFSILEVYFQ